MNLWHQSMVPATYRSSVLAVIEIKNTTYNIKRSMTLLASITQVITHHEN